MTVTKFSTPLPWPNFRSANAAQFPSLSTQTGRPRASEIGVLRSTEDHSWINLVEWRTTPSCGFTRPPVEIPEKQIETFKSKNCVSSSQQVFIKDVEFHLFSYQHQVSCSWGAQHPAQHLYTFLTSVESCQHKPLDWLQCIFWRCCPGQQ